MTASRAALSAITALRSKGITETHLALIAGVDVDTMTRSIIALGARRLPEITLDRIIRACERAHEIGAPLSKSAAAAAAMYIAKEFPDAARKLRDYALC